MWETLLKNPKLWLALVALAVLIIANFVPGFQVDQDKAAEGLVVIALYIYGVINDPGANTWASLFSSRKFWVAVLAEVGIWLSAFQVYPPLGLTYDQIAELLTAVAAALILAFTHTSLPLSPKAFTAGDPFAKRSPPSKK